MHKAMYWWKCHGMAVDTNDGHEEGNKEMVEVVGANTTVDDGQSNHSMYTTNKIKHYLDSHIQSTILFMAKCVRNKMLKKPYNNTVLNILS